VFVDKELTGGFKKGETVRLMLAWDAKLGTGLTVSPCTASHTGSDVSKLTSTTLSAIVGLLLEPLRRQAHERDAELRQFVSSSLFVDDVLPFRAEPNQPRSL